DGLFLIYTRRGANNDNVFRNRAPLFMAQVDPEKLVVIRATERILMPNTGATFGNFGATAVNENESWVTDAEGIFGEALKPGVNCRVLNARIIWSKPNRLVK
ncbi:MAG: exo-alpha-sialidase, partial [Candidatus Hydrogenedentes bacterium]|nr:exo-alpha-sialidase [Candidatus Hydrogenedentota bacterium]